MSDSEMMADVDELSGHRTDLERYLKRHMRLHEDVDDLIHDVYVRVLEAQPKQVSNWRAFLTKVARNCLIDRSRAASVRDRAAGALNMLHGERVSPSAEDILLNRGRLSQVACALELYDAMTQAVFIAVRIDGKSHRAAGAPYGLDQKAVSRIIEKVMRRLIVLEAGDK